MWTSVAIFALTYLLISGRRLNLIRIGRPAGVMLGCVLMVAFGVIRPSQAYGLVNWDTIILLLGMMVVTEHLAEAGFFELAAAWLDRRRMGPRRLLAVLVFGSGILAGFLVNDIVCIFFTPLLIIIVQRHRLPALPFLLALATATNIGGLMSLTGNPQNMIIASLSGLSFRQYFVFMLPIGVLCLGLNYLLLLLVYRRELAACGSQPSDTAGASFPSQAAAPLGRGKPLLKRSLFTLAMVIAGFFIFPSIAWVAFSGAAMIMLLSNRNEAELLKRIDWNLLLFFACLFMVTGALQYSGATAFLTERAGSLLGDSIDRLWLFGGLSILASNLFANVPYVLIIAESIQTMSQDPRLMWYCLAFSSTIAGNLTLLGAVANIIVAEKARHIHDIGFFDFLRFGLPSTLLNAALGLGILSLYRLAGWL